MVGHKGNQQQQRVAENGKIYFLVPADAHDDSILFWCFFSAPQLLTLALRFTLSLSLCLSFLCEIKVYKSVAKQQLFKTKRKYVKLERVILTAQCERALELDDDCARQAKRLGHAKYFSSFAHVGCVVVSFCFEFLHCLQLLFFSSLALILRW